MVQIATNTIPTALVLSRPGLLTAATREGLQCWRRALPPEPHTRPVRGRWGMLANDWLPDLVVAEHADPMLLAMLCSDLLRRVWLPDTWMFVLVGERDDTLRHLLAPLPLPLTVISPALLPNWQVGTLVESSEPGVHWAGVHAPPDILPRWAVVPLLPALARAGSVAEAAAWCGMARSTAYDILSTTARHLGLPRRWRHPYQWSRDIVAGLDAPRPARHNAISAATCGVEHRA